MTSLVTAYVLDDRNTIISVSGDWDEFAEQNGAANLYSVDVCGRPIWDFVGDAPTRMWLEAVFQSARLRGVGLERSYRCDSPEVKRYMKMRVIPEQNATLRIEHELLSTEQRQAPVHLIHDSTLGKDARRRCSLCGRLNHVGEWQEPREDHANASGSIVVIYTVCEDCQNWVVLGCSPDIRPAVKAGMRPRG